MKPRYIIQGSDNWQSRSGYQYARRNDGSSFEREAGPVFHWSMRGLYVAIMVFAICASLYWGGGQ